MRNYQVDLHVLETSTRPAVMHLEPEHVHLIISDDQATTMHFGPKEMPFPPYSVYLMFSKKSAYQMSVISEEPSNILHIHANLNDLHLLLSKSINDFDFSSLHVFSQDQYHKFDPSNATLQTVARQTIENKDNTLLLEAYKFQLLNAYFNSATNTKTYSCPFLNQKDNVEKVRQAKSVLIEDLRNAPTIKELARIVALNEYNLKTGFKEIYGHTIHSYLKDYKMNRAKELLQDLNHQISDVADELGYSNVSHFIDTFKKKYGLTPKKFQLSLTKQAG
jgi:AraC family transcriptional activator of pyochelin receptor